MPDIKPGFSPWGTSNRLNQSFPNSDDRFRKIDRRQPQGAPLNLDQFLADWGQHLAPSIRDHHHVFNSNAALAG